MNHITITISQQKQFKTNIIKTFKGPWSKLEKKLFDENLDAEPDSEFFLNPDVI